MDNMMMNDSFFLDDERALIAHHVNVCSSIFNDSSDSLLAKYAQKHPGEDLDRMAGDALVTYFHQRDKAVRTLVECAQCDEPVTFARNPQVEKMKKLYLDVLREQYQGEVLNLPIEERCNRLYAFLQSIDGAVLRESSFTIMPYTGEVSEEAEQQLMEKLCDKLARLNISANKMYDVKEELLSEDVNHRGYLPVRNACDDLLAEAKCLYVLAHEGKLERFSRDISMDECVRFVALAQDMNELRRAERAGEIGSEVAAVLALALVTLAGLALAVLAGAQLWIAALAAEGAKASLLMCLAAIYSIFVAACLDCTLVEKDEFKDQLNEKLSPALHTMAGGMARFGSYVTLILPQKIKRLFGRAGAGAGGSAPAAVPAQAEERPRDFTPDLPPA